MDPAPVRLVQSTHPAARLNELEEIVERGLATFLEVGRALAEIREEKLYRQVGFDRFDTYVKSRFGISRTHAYQLIGARQVVEAVSAIEDIEPPRNEAQARELVPLMRKAPDAVAETWAAIQEHFGETLTAKDVRVVVSRRLDGRPRSEWFGEDHNKPNPFEPHPPVPAPTPPPEYGPRERLVNFERVWQQLMNELREVLDDLLEPGPEAYARAGLSDRVKQLYDRIEEDIEYPILELHVDTNKWVEELEAGWDDDEDEEGSA